MASVERAASLALGGALLAYGAKVRGPRGLAAAFAGGLLMHRGATGTCVVYRSLGVTTAHNDADFDLAGSPPRRDVTGKAATVNARKALRVERTVTINAPRTALYAFWRDFANLPRFMEHLESVSVISDNRSRWRAKGPAGRSVEWHATLVNDIPDKLIAWKSVGHPDVANAGSVNFSDAPGNRGTIVKVLIDYEPPAGWAGSLIARAFGEDPDRQVREDLRKFKQLMETGAITTSARRAADTAWVGPTPKI